MVSCGVGSCTVKTGHSLWMSMLLGVGSWLTIVPVVVRAQPISPAIPWATEVAPSEPALLLSQTNNNADAADVEASGGDSGDEGTTSGNTLTPTADRLRIGSNRERGFSYGFGTQLGEPTALSGGTRLRVTSSTAQRALLFPVAGFVQYGFGPEARLLLEMIADSRAFGADLSLSFQPNDFPGFVSVNIQNQSHQSGSFNGGNNVDLITGSDPWVNRIGGGLEYAIDATAELDLAAAVNYQTVSIRNGMFSRVAETRDSQGNPVTVSDDGFDPLLTVNLSGLWNHVDDRAFPTRGTRVRFGFDQSVPIGEADISMTRLSATVSQFIPLNASSERPHTLIFSAQGGAHLGEVPPYEAFSIGSAFTVRGFPTGEVGTGSSALMATAEYRYPITSFTTFGQDIALRGSLFFDYGTDLGTADQVIGRPGSVRNKEGDGFSYGAGFLAQTSAGLFRIEPTLNDDGEFTLHVTVGDRF